MLFNSYEFILLFLPIVLGGFWLIGRGQNREAAIVWLVLASLFYYGWWKPKYLVLIVASMGFNFFVGQSLARKRFRRVSVAKSLLITGIAFNLGLLGYYKYANFFVGNANALLSTSYDVGTIILPLAISFFTFQQIAYLVDAYRGETSEYNFRHYALFVTFFPQLIAGPIVHHKEMMPQFMRDETLKPHLKNVAIGLTIFAIGLFKKTVLADGAAVYASPVFSDALDGKTLSFFVAWGGALAYCMQIYFDFSGYSDMAIGAARLFGIKLPMNFFSPYKATSIVEFWRRWHMTLSRFLRDYVYIPLGGNAHGNVRRYTNLISTMLLGGLWHGAGWTFVVWGLLQGAFLSINHAWHWICVKLGIEPWRQTAVWKCAAWSLTFLAVNVSWVFFRAESFDAAFLMLEGMFGFNGVEIPNAIYVRLAPEVQALLNGLGVGSYLGGGATFLKTYAWVCALLPVVTIFPNTMQIMREFEPAHGVYILEGQYAVQMFPRAVARVCWSPSVSWLMAMGMCAALAFLGLSSISEFLYFQF